MLDNELDELINDTSTTSVSGKRKSLGRGLGALLGEDVDIMSSDSAENKNILSKEQLELRDTIPMVRQKPVEVISELSKPEADKEVEIVSDDEIIVVEEETIDIKEEAKEVSKEESIINIDIKEDATEDAAQEENKPQPTAEEEFASEGEEIIEEVIEELPENAQESEPIEIVITNE